MGTGTLIAYAAGVNRRQTAGSHLQKAFIESSSIEG